MSSFTPTPIQFTVALLLSALLVSGCSDSGDSTSPEVADADAPTVIADDGTGGIDGGSTDGTTGETVGEPTDVVPVPVTPDPVTTDPVTPDPVTTDPVTPDPVTTDPVTPDPVTQNSTLVSFDITVPVYVSNALQVRLVWANKDLTAKWVGDEFWAASDDFPTNEEHLLVVTFYDRNGDITLGSFETKFKTGTNAAESYKITADQFDTKQWDDDGDGESNLNELSAGADPLVDESTLLEVRDPFRRPDTVALISSISGSYERSVPAQRPYNVHTEKLPPLDIDDYSYRETHIVTIDIDELGSGSYSDKFRSWEFTNTHIENQVATRTNTGNSIVWTGKEEFSDTSAALWWEIVFTTESVAIDGQTRKQDGVIDRDNLGNGATSRNGTANISYSLTGKVIEDSPRCEPVAGTIEYEANDLVVENRPFRAKTTITKDIDDQYWLFSKENIDGDIVEKYLVRDIDFTFHCSF